MSIVDALRRASEALREYADDLQALSDEVYQAGGQMSEEQFQRADNLWRGADLTTHRLDNALVLWRIDRQIERDKASREKEK